MDYYSYVEINAIANRIETDEEYAIRLSEIKRIQDEETRRELEQFEKLKSKYGNTLLCEVIDYYEDETFLKADGFDNAVIGVDETTMRLIYSVKKCIEILIEEGLTYEDAMEHFSFNVSGSYVGGETPIWCQDNFA